MTRLEEQRKKLKFILFVCETKGIFEDEIGRDFETNQPIYAFRAGDNTDYIRLTNEETCRPLDISTAFPSIKRGKDQKFYEGIFNK